MPDVPGRSASPTPLRWYGLDSSSRRSAWASGTAMVSRMMSQSAVRNWMPLVTHST
jgi:hypothetical protein